MKYFVTGCSGFIASNLVDYLLKKGNEVVGFDNFSTGQENFILLAKNNPNYQIIKGDILDYEKLKLSMGSCDFVFSIATVCFYLWGTTKRSG
jgi:UDP-glucose 4-epimerase